MLEITAAIATLEQHLRELEPGHPWQGRRLSEAAFLDLARQQQWTRIPFRDHNTVGYDERELWSFVCRLAGRVPVW